MSNGNLSAQTSQDLLCPLLSPRSIAKERAYHPYSEVFAAPCFESLARKLHAMLRMVLVVMRFMGRGGRFRGRGGIFRDLLGQPGWSFLFGRVNWHFQ